MKIKRKDLLTLYKLYWKKYWSCFKIEHVVFKFKPYSNVSPEQGMGRKLKRKQFYPHYYSYSTRTPKYHNKLYHIRPRRRDTRLLEHKLLHCSSVEEMEAAEEKYYVNHRKHIYWS